MKTGYALYVPPPIERQLRQLRASVRKTIASRLKEIVEALEALPKGKTPQPLGPALRFYVEGYRIFYQVEAKTRQVVVLELRTAFA